MAAYCRKGWRVGLENRPVIARAFVLITMTLAQNGPCYEEQTQRYCVQVV
jgi:hypothetical protein